MTRRWTRFGIGILVIATLGSLEASSAVHAPRPMPVRTLSDTRPKASAQPIGFEEAYRKLSAAYPYQLQSGGGSRQSLYGRAKGSHVVIVQLESFQNMLLRARVGGREVTPNLNRLAEESLYFPHVYQQIGHGNTSDAEFIVNSSLYPVGVDPMAERYADRSYPSLARLLHRQGYTASTFHVNEASFWNRVRLYPALGFDQYYDKPYFRQERFSRFGASDEELFRVGIRKMKAADRAGQLFFAQFVTVSSHSPYVIPEESIRLKVEEKWAKSPLGRYVTSVNYADYALGTFIQHLKEAGLWNRTLLVVYGDHFGLNRKKFKAEEVGSALGIPYHPVPDTYNVPLVIHLPGQRSGVVIKQSGGQVDILPTLANLMGIELEAERFITFGHDLLNIDHNLIGMRYYLPAGSFVDDDVFFVPGPKGFADGKAVSITTGQAVDLSPQLKEQYRYIMKWQKLSDRYVKEIKLFKPKDRR